eukprot:CAMPEP_0115831096 /NCGR_PEP_ID=MMETSP0287-20121206/1961_1 /TAXON_ID=412157 /ORGANISM="Chrysochromulina rotalis, Strain UIO044" /LENGTH=108 /DNA_ID=CAMNT_0003284429 /DNA_START=764 /DNA_END=1086 /DNA_ORIENTATION=-
MTPLVRVASAGRMVALASHASTLELSISVVTFVSLNGSVGTTGSADTGGAISSRTAVVFDSVSLASSLSRDARMRNVVGDSANDSIACSKERSCPSDCSVGNFTPALP